MRELQVSAHSRKQAEFLEKIHGHYGAEVPENTGLTAKTLSTKTSRLLLVSISFRLSADTRIHCMIILEVSLMLMHLCTIRNALYKDARQIHYLNITTDGWAAKSFSSSSASA